MVHAPLRGLFFLGRTATVLVAAAAGAYILKKNRRLAEQVGETLIKVGENLRGEAKASAAEPKTAEPVVQSEKPKATRTAKAAPKAGATRTTAKPSAKAAPNRPTAPKKKAAPKPKAEAPKE